MAESFEVNDLVWAKMKGYPPWPARISDPDEQKAPKSKKSQHYVYFFGSHNFAWISDEFIVPHSEKLLEVAKGYKKKYGGMQEGIVEIETAAEEVKKTADLKVKAGPSKEKSLQLESTSGKTKMPKGTTKKMIKNNTRVPLKKKRFLTKADIDRKRPKTQLEPVEASSLFEKDSTSIKMDYYYELLKKNVPPNNAIPRMDVDSQPIPSTSNSDPSTTTLSERPPKLKSLMLPPTTKKIGFLGLGNMGTEIVKSFLKTGHHVTVWNRTKQKCDQFRQQGVQVAETPADVMHMCDITFCCVADAEASRAVAFGKHGVVEGLSRPCSSRAGDEKGYVEMTSIDPDTSIEIGNAICAAGGVYLEAPVIGSRQWVKKRGLTVITAGDSALFHNCGTCFAAFTPNAFKISGGVGNAAKLNLAYCMFSGTLYAALDEAMHMLADFNLNQNLFLCCIGLGQQRSSFLLDKGYAMVTGDPTVHNPLKNVQKDLEMAIQLGKDLNQPLSTAAVANDIMKLAANKYPDHDATAVHLCSNL